MVMLRAISKNLIYFFTFSLLLFSPLPIGSVEPWARVVLQLQAFSLLFLWLLWSFFSEDNSGSGTGTRSYLPLLGFLLICLLQIVPLPGFVLEIFSEMSLEIWEENRSVLSNVGFVQEKGMFTISLYPHATWRNILLFLSYVAFGFVVSKSFRTERRVKILIIPALAVSLFEATYGIYQYLLDIKNTAYPDVISATGTFVNRNHFAGFLEMCIPLALGYIMSLSEWHESRPKSFIKRLVSSDNLPKRVLLLFLLGIMLLALVLSKSRMGIFSAFLSMVFFYIAYSSLKETKTSKVWMLLFVLAVAVFYGLWIGLYSVFERFLRIEAEAPGRTLVWKDMLNMIRDFPIFGTGFGTFGYVYPLYKESMERAVVYTYAHNDYLQLIAETGILGSFSLLAALILFISSSLRTLSHLSQEGDYFRFFLVLGALSGIVSIMIHSLADFNLHIPSNALYFAFLIGFLKATASSEFKKARVRRRRIYRISEMTSSKIF
jgi:Lipid A core - O-antigen ligase and related enzymes